MTVQRAFSVAVLSVLLLPVTAGATDRFALVVAGASGGPDYAQQFTKWAEALREVLDARMKIPAANVIVLSDAGDRNTVSSAANVQRALGALRKRMGRDDLLFIVLIGHGTYDGTDAKFNLVGPDLDSAQWAALLSGVSGRVVLVNTTAASFPFLERLSGERRIVITATDSAAQRFDTVFPQFFIGAFGDEAADIDKNGRISIWEAFAGATAGVRRYYQQRGQLATERPLIDDNGDGVGREAAGQGEDGSTASRTYLDQPIAGAPPTDEVLLQLLQKRAALEAEIDELRIRRSFMPADEYEREFERIMVALARVAREVRQRIKS